MRGEEWDGEPRARTLEPRVRPVPARWGQELNLMIVVAGYILVVIGAPFAMLAGITFKMPLWFAFGPVALGAVLAMVGGTRAMRFLL